MENKTWKPMTAGILSIISGAPTAVGGIALAVVGEGVTGLGIISLIKTVPWLSGILGVVAVFITAISIAMTVVGALAIVGGIYALKRRKWGLALAGSICSLFCNKILGILAIIFVSMGKSEFE